MTDTNSLSHSKRNCKYHIVIASKYRRKVIYQKIKVDIGKILIKLCKKIRPIRVRIGLIWSK